MSLAELWVDVRLGFNKAEKDLTQGAGKLNAEPAGRKVGSRFAAGFSASLKGLGGVVAAVVSAKAIGQISSLAQQASDLNETVSKSQNIFGKNAKAMELWASRSAVAFGLSKQAALEGAASFGNFFDQIGIGGKQSVKMSQGLVKLSGDLASFNNADPAKVMEAFQSATRGEYDSLQAFIPTVSAATVQTEALRLSHKKSAKDLTSADNALALYAIAQRDAGKAQGDFARTSGGLANQQRILKAQLADLRTTIGGALLPVFQQTAVVLTSKVLPPLQALAVKHAPAVRDALAKIVPAVGQVYDVLKKGDFTGGPFAEDSKFVDVLFKIREALQQAVPTVKAFFASMKAQGADKSLASIGDSLVKLGPAIQEFVSQAHGVGPTVTIGAGALKLFADHADTIVKFMPALVAGYVAYKAAQAAANIAATLSAPLKIAEIIANRQLTKSNKLLVASRVELTATTVTSTVAETASTTAKNAGIVALVRGRIATIASAVATNVLTIATKAWGIAVKVASGPVGWIIAAIGILVPLIISLYKNNETARKIIDGAWKGIQTVIKVAWERVIRPTLKLWITMWLTVVGVIIDGAAKAFGWIPGIGGKLKKVQEEFHKLRDGINGALGGIKSKTVGIGAKITFPPDWQNYRAGERAMGGPIHGPGSGTSDTAGLYALSNGEHVVTAREVKGAGGHGAVQAMRQMWAHGISGLAGGGPAGLNVRASVPTGATVGGFAGRISHIFEGAAISFAKKLQKEFSFGGRALNFARSQVGKPYVWGGVGPGGYDCSGFMSAITNVIQGRSPYSRRFTTATFPASGFAAGPGRFMIGRTRNAGGGIGHMAGTLAGVNVESRGSAGVVVGPRARGAYNGLFGGQVWHLKGFARGGPVGDPPYDLLDPRGRDFVGRDMLRQLFGSKGHYAFANGGVITEPIFGVGRSGRTYTFGEGGRPETITPGRDATTLTFVNQGVVTTADVENWFVGVQRNIKRKGRG